MGTLSQLIPGNPDGQAVIIRQVGQLTGPPIVISLRRKNGAEVPVTVADELISNQTWYPGRGDASTQVMGIKREPIILQGWFRDPLDFLIGSPRTRAKLLQSLFATQAECELQWGEVISRRGFIKRVEIGNYRNGIIRYRITFAPTEANDVEAKLPSGFLFAIGQQVSQALEEVLAVAESLLDIKRAANAAGAFIPGFSP